VTKRAIGGKTRKNEKKGKERKKKRGKFEENRPFLSHK
jgi:hypothetical protein